MGVGECTDFPIAEQPRDFENRQVLILQIASGKIRSQPIENGREGEPFLRKSTDDLPTSETEEAEGSGGYGLVAYRAMQSAIDAAKSLGNSYEGTEHLLLGLATEQSSDAAQVLAAHGITRDRLFEALQAENDSGLEKLMATVLDGADETMPGQCQACGVSPAIVHVTEIKGNTMRGVHLCEECARKHGVGWV